MIEWMQRHKKWLVITIWVSTISFIAAGMVGWGTYNFSLHGDAVAKVGSITISPNEYAREYQRIYNLYNDLFKGQLDEGKAKEMGIDKLAINMLVNQSLQLSLANDLDIKASSDDILKMLYSIDAFHIDGKFDAKKYKDVLARVGMTPRAFEESVAKQITLEKLGKLLRINVTASEINALSPRADLFDNIRLRALSAPAPLRAVDDSMLRPFWEKTKDDYQSLPRYTITYDIIPLDETMPIDDAAIRDFYTDNKVNYINDEGNLLSLDEAKASVRADIIKDAANKEALKAYIKLKKKDAKGTKSVTIDSLPPSGAGIFEAISAQDKGTTLKPILASINALSPSPKKDAIDTSTDGTKASKSAFYVIKLLDRKEAHALSYEMAKAKALKAYLLEENTAALERKAKKAAKAGLDSSIASTGFINSIGQSMYDSLAKPAPLSGYSMQESQEILAKIFASPSLRGYILLKDKALIYDVSEQRLLGLSDAGFVDIVQLQNMTREFKTRYLDDKLLSLLRQQYKVEIFTKNLRAF